MDFANRSSQPQTAVPSAHPTPGSTNSGLNNRKSNSSNQNGGKFIRLGVGALLAYLLAVVILIAAVLLILGLDRPKSESSFVQPSKLQAVFLNTGQVYFGNIKILNNNYFELENIYYLQTGSSASGSKSAANTSVSLVKLGCELHAPFDRMLINSKEVTFWENLQDNGQVAKAVKTFQQQNPQGQKCTDQSAASSTSSGAVQGANPGTSNPSSTTPVTSTPSSSAPTRSSTPVKP